MAMELLRCVICPKQPCFSDISHLLTHVSSKGHLAHLHKLQVRSHQEIQAGQQLIAYNHWYMQHGLAELLSERMQQKEARLASKLAGNQRRAAIAVKKQMQKSRRSNDFGQPTIGHQNMSAYQQPSHASLRDRRRAMQEEMDDPDYDPRLMFEHQVKANNVLPMFDRTTSSIYPELPDQDDINVEKALSPITPECSRLKGTIWPGMMVFDAATEEMQKKRNQKKDGSVLKHMQANSAMIEPMEATYSPGGTMRRKRHMNDLEGEDGLIEGETPIRKRSIKRKKRRAARSGTKTSSQGERRSGPYKRAATLLSPSTPTSSDVSSPPDFKGAHLVGHLPLMESQGLIIEPVKVDLKRKKPKNEFNIFTDESPLLQHATSFNNLSNPFSGANRLFGQLKPSQSYLEPAPWLQPQQDFYHPEYDPFKELGGMRTATTVSDDVDTGKENNNPLSWKHDQMTDHVISPMRMLDGNFDDFEAELGPLSQVYAYTRNPLADTFFIDSPNTNMV